MISQELPHGLASPPPISEQLWLSCADLAARALTSPFVSQLAAGTLKKASFQHYIAQNAFYLAALSDVYERARALIRDARASRMLQELRNAVVEELGKYGGYAKAWDIDCKDHPELQQATKSYIDFLFEATSGAPEVCPHASCDCEVGPTASKAEMADASITQHETSSQRKCNGEESGMGQITGIEQHPQSVEGDLTAAKAVAALVPCMRLYAFLGTETSRGRDLDGHPYKGWIESHASTAFQASAVKMQNVLDSVCKQDGCLEALLPVYGKAMLLELNFFAAQPGLD